MSLPRKPFKEQVGDENDLEQLNVRRKGEKLKRLASEVTLSKKRQGRLPLIKSNDISRDKRQLKRVTLQEMGLPENAKAMDVLSPEHKVMSANNSLLNPLNKKKNKLKNMLRF